MIDRECLHGTPALAPDHRVDLASKQACPLNDRDDHFNCNFSADSGVWFKIFLLTNFVFFDASKTLLLS